MEVNMGYDLCSSGAYNTNILAIFLVVVSSPCCCHNPPLFWTIFQSHTPVAFANVLLRTGNQYPSSLASSSVTSETFSWCLLVVTSKCPGDSGMISKNAITRGVLNTTNADGETRSALKATGADGGTGAKVEPIVQNGQSPTLCDGSNDMAGNERNRLCALWDCIYRRIPLPVWVKEVRVDVGKWWFMGQKM